MKHKTLLVFCLVWPLVAATLSFAFSLNAFISPILFFGIPSFILSMYKPALIRKAFLASLLITPITIICDFIAEKTHAWQWPLPSSLFHFRFFSYVSIESIIWAFLQIYVVIVFFQFFFGKALMKKSLNKRSEEAIASTITISVIFLFVALFFPLLLNIPYWYLTLGILVIMPMIVFEEFKYPKVFSRLLKTAAYFCYLNFTYEFTALSLKWWNFPSGQFIGSVSFLGRIFPLEELLFWIMLSSLTVLSYYEYFFNGER